MKESCKGAISLILNLLVINNEHDDRLKQTKKRRVKLNWLIRNIPMEGAKALETVWAIAK
jgi:hypothetical protein